MQLVGEVGAARWQLFGQGVGSDQETNGFLVDSKRSWSKTTCVSGWVGEEVDA